MSLVNVASVSAPVVATPAPARERWSWALYDLANTMFSMNVATLFFAVWLVADLGASNSMVALANGVASALVMVSIPIFGAVSDVTRRRKPWVVTLTLVAVGATLAIGALGEYVIPYVGDSVVPAAGIRGYTIAGLPLALVLAAFIVANYAYQGALPFYNAMMPELAPPDRWGRLSGLGAALGYLGSIIGVLLVTPFFNGALPVLGPIPERVMEELRRIVPLTAHGGRMSTFAPTALLYLAFSLPLFIFGRDRFAATRPGAIPWRTALRDVARTVRETRTYPGAARFIVASFIYQDAMGTVVSFMALYAVVAMGFRRGSEATLFVILTVPAVLGSWIWGKATDRFGPRRTLLVVIAAWVVLLVAMILAPSQSAFWMIGAGVGLIYGGVGVAERPLLLRLVPVEEAGRFFGIMVLSARAAAIVGPFIWGVAVDGLTPILGERHAYQAAVGTVAVAMALAWVVLRGVPEPDVLRHEVSDDQPLSHQL